MSKNFGIKRVKKTFRPFSFCLFIYIANYYKLLLYLYYSTIFSIMKLINNQINMILNF